jgi:Holliday junction resolvasome RuvABC endonuclease subunit
MRILGVDPSSSCTGLALIDDNELLLTDTWKRPTNGSAPERLSIFYDWLHSWLRRQHPQLACVEFLSVERNAQSTSVVAHYQAISTLAAKRCGLIVIEARVTSARKAVLGDGSLSKRDVFDTMRRRYPDHDFGRFDQGGADKTDALCLALAAASLAEM